jgi:hypothetical protein
MQTLKESGMNDRLRKPRPPQADLSALGIVAKDQGLTGCCESQNRSNLLLMYCYHILLLFFCYEPLGTSLRGFRRRLFMERLNG